MFLFQHAYICDLLKRIKMSEAKEVTAPISSLTSLSLYNGSTPIDSKFKFSFQINFFNKSVNLILKIKNFSLKW